MTPANPLRVFIGNLPFSTTGDELRAVFADCGKIVDATIVANPRGRAKGCVTDMLRPVCVCSLHCVRCCVLQLRLCYLRR